MLQLWHCYMDYQVCVSILVTKILDRLKNADFERAMKLVTGRIDVQDDDRLMRLVFQEALENGALKFEF